MGSNHNNIKYIISPVIWIPFGFKTMSSWNAHPRKEEQLSKMKGLSPKMGRLSAKVNNMTITSIQPRTPKIVPGKNEIKN